MGRYLRMYWLPGSKSTASRSAPSSLGGGKGTQEQSVCVGGLSQSDSTSGYYSILLAFPTSSFRLLTEI